MSWSEAGDLVVIVSDASFFVLKFNREAVDAQLSTAGEEGVTDAFEVVAEISEVATSGTWAGDCYIYTTSTNRLEYVVGGKVNTVAHFDKPLFVLGYIAANNRVYLMDKEYQIVSYTLSLLILEYQTAILRDEPDVAETILRRIPKADHNAIARFLEGQDKLDLALEVSKDPEFRFDLAVQLKRLDLAFEIASQVDSEAKWRQLADLSMTDLAKLSIAEGCLRKAKDVGALLQLYVAQGNANGLAFVAQQARTFSGKDCFKSFA